MNEIKSTVRDRVNWIMIGFFLLSVARPVSAQDHTEYVRRVKQAVEAAGISLDHGPGECGRAEVAHRVAWGLKAEGWGLIAKSGSQNGCSPGFASTADPKYGVDALVKPDGTCVDILGGGAEGPNTPQWAACTSSGSLYRPAYDPGPPYVSPTPGPVDPPPASNLEQRVSALELDMVRVKDAIAVLSAKAGTQDGQIEDLYRRVADDAARLANLEHLVTELQARPVYASCSVQFGLRCELRK